LENEDSDEGISEDKEREREKEVLIAVDYLRRR
jgi:hypothetical protein